MLQCVLSGVSIGAIYGLLGLALALSFYVTRVINFAQGQMLTMAIVVAASLSEAGTVLGLASCSAPSQPARLAFCPTLSP